MSLAARTEAIRRALFARPEHRLYAVLDGAAFEGLPAVLQRYGVEHVCLLRGELDPELAQVAPYLATVPPDSEFAAYLLEQGWGDYWGLFVRSACDFRTLRMHLRQLLEVWDPEGTPLYFRFYDPRVFRVFLPTCDDEQLEQIFDDVVEAFFTEGEDASQLLRFSLGGSGLSTSRILVSATPTVPTE